MLSIQEGIQKIKDRRSSLNAARFALRQTMRVTKGLGLPLSLFDDAGVNIGEGRPGYAGALHFQGIPIDIEVKAGQTRTGTNRQGKSWSRVLSYHYGEIRGTRGVDGDPIDVYVGANPLAPMAFVIHQRVQHSGDEDSPTLGTYDEDKVFLGFSTKASAMRAYLENTPTKRSMPNFMPGISEISVCELARRLADGELTYGVSLVKSLDLVKGAAKPIGTVSRHGKVWKVKVKAVRGAKDNWRTVKSKADADALASRVRGGKKKPEPEAEQPKPERKRRPRRKKPTPVVVEPATEEQTPPGERRVVDRVPAGRAAVFLESEAAEGTFRHRLENGHYELQQTQYSDGSTSVGVAIPEEDWQPILQEFDRLINGVVRRSSSRYRVTYSPQMAEDLKQSAALGFLKATLRYEGGAAFIPLAMRYAQAEVVASIRRNQEGAPLTDRQLRNLNGYAAARTRAEQKHGESPTLDQIAEEWTISKSEFFRDTKKKNLGTYRDNEGNTVDQRTEELPLEPWHLRNPDGTFAGQSYPGKYELIERYEEFLDGRAMDDSKWSPDLPGEIVDIGPADRTVVETVQLQEDFRKVIDQMQDKGFQREVLTLGLLLDFADTDRDTAPATSADPEQGVRSIAQGRYQEIADELNITGSIATQRRKVVEAIKRARAMFIVTADAMGSQIGQYIGRAKPSEERPPPELRTVVDYKPAYNQLLDRWGNRERVNLYLTLERAGFGAEAAESLDRVVSGDASEDDQEFLKLAFFKQRKLERLAALQQQTKTLTVDPSAARDFGMQGNPGPADLLESYADQTFTDRLMQRNPIVDGQGNVIGTGQKVAVPKTVQDFVNAEQRIRPAGPTSPIPPVNMRTVTAKMVDREKRIVANTWNGITVRAPKAKEAVVFSFFDQKRNFMGYTPSPSATADEVPADVTFDETRGVIERVDS